MVAVRHGMGRKHVIPLWTGEGQLPTPDFIRDATIDALRNGETVYTWNRGIPDLRQALAEYHTRLFDREFSSENFFVTGGGMQAMQTAFQLIAGEGDEFVDMQVETARANRDLVAAKLAEYSNVEFQVPEGDFYLFFRVDGMGNSEDLVIRIIDEANVGFTPSGTFGPGGEGWLRMCYLRDPPTLETALDRIGTWLQSARL